MSVLKLAVAMRHRVWFDEVWINQEGELFGNISIKTRLLALLGFVAIMLLAFGGSGTLGLCTTIVDSNSNFINKLLSGNTWLTWLH